MSTSLLHNVFGLRGHRFRHTRFENGQVRLAVELKYPHLRCSVCQSRRMVRRGTL